ncbi:MAG: Crp/Fnr family transcriptional regulator [Bacteroidetes bacterium]|nr:Crp/Fnr family transcriptional regulator [Bacteroidota bacterium]
MSDIQEIKASCTVPISTIHPFEYLTPEQRELIEKHKVVIEYKKGEIIAKQGTFTTHIIYICEGLAKVYYEDNSKSLILRIAPTGSLIGLTSLPINQNVFQYTASAYINTTVKLIDINTIRRLILENGKFATSIIDVLCEVAIQKNGRFFCLTHRQAFGKLADIILCLAGNIFKTQKFDLSLSRKELAELSGMSTESVIRTLKKFQEDGLIKMTGKTFEVVDVEGLMRICQLG